MRKRWKRDFFNFKLLFSNESTALEWDNKSNMARWQCIIVSYPITWIIRSKIIWFFCRWFLLLCTQIILSAEDPWNRRIFCCSANHCWLAIVFWFGFFNRLLDLLLLYHSMYQLYIQKTSSLVQNIIGYYNKWICTSKELIKLPWSSFIEKASHDKIIFAKDQWNDVIYHWYLLERATSSQVTE